MTEQQKILACIHYRFGMIGIERYNKLAQPMKDNIHRMLNVVHDDISNIGEKLLALGTVENILARH